MITLNWKLHNVVGADYYYTFYKDKFWCIKAEFVENGIVTDHTAIFQVTESKMDERTKNGLVIRLTHLFPELSLDQIKQALRYDKNAFM